MFATSKSIVNRQHHSGFSLIELVIVIAIVSILATIAVPGYSSYLKQSRRDDARHLLLLNAQRLQRCFTLEGVYNGSCVTRDNSKGNYYSMSAGSQISATTFTLIAEPVAGTSQASDEMCTTFIYSHTGRRSATGTSTDNCW